MLQPVRTVTLREDRRARVVGQRHALSGHQGRLTSQRLCSLFVVPLNILTRRGGAGRDNSLSGFVVYNRSGHGIVLNIALWMGGQEYRDQVRLSRVHDSFLSACGTLGAESSTTSAPRPSGSPSIVARGMAAALDFCGVARMEHLYSEYWNASANCKGKETRRTSCHWITKPVGGDGMMGDVLAISYQLKS
jgi:hypothetical protein